MANVRINFANSISNRISRRPPPRRKRSCFWFDPMKIRENLQDWSRIRLLDQIMEWLILQIFLEGAGLIGQVIHLDHLSRATSASITSLGLVLMDFQGKWQIFLDTNSVWVRTAVKIIENTNHAYSLHILEEFCWTFYDIVCAWLD